MAFIPTADTAQFEAVFQWDGQIVENVLHYRNTADGVTESNLPDFAETLLAYIRTTLLPLMADTVTLLRLVAKGIDILDGIVYVATTSLPDDGGGGSPALPNSNTISYSWRTGSSGRSFRGRSYIIGLQEGHVTGNDLTSGAITAFGAAMEGLRTVGVDDGWEMVIVSKYHAGAPRTTGVATLVTSSFFVDTKVDVQRRRLPGRGS